MSQSYAYPVSSFGRFMSDQVRTNAYLGAMSQAISPDSVVVNIGAGTGLFAMLAARLGARRVIAIEANDIISLAQQIAQVNGLAESIEFIQGMSTEIELDEPADVIVSDLHGVLPYFEHNIPSIVDARQRLLAPGGMLLPHMEHIWIAPVRAPSYYSRRYEKTWTHNYLDLDMRPARNMMINDWHRSDLRPNQLVGTAVHVATIDYTSVIDENLNASASWQFEQPIASHGFSMWFDAKIHGDYGFSNRPGQPKLIYGQAFFPFEHPVQIKTDETLAIIVSARIVADEYIWNWKTTIIGANGQARLTYRQSTLWSQLTSISQMRSASTI